MALWLFVAVVLLRGIGAILSTSEPVHTAASGPARAGFPDAEARAFALRFVSAYLDELASGTGRREAPTVARFLADGVSDRAAVHSPRRGLGARVAWATVAREASLGDARALITVAAVTRAGRGRYVTVPVARDARGGLAVFDPPSFSPPPARGEIGGAEPSPLSGGSAEAIGELAGRFVRAYVSGADRSGLAYLLAPGARVVPMPEGLRVVSVGEIDRLASSSPGRRVVRVSVRARERLTGAVYGLSYRLELVRRDRWYLAAVAGGPSA